MKSRRLKTREIYLLGVLAVVALFWLIYGQGTIFPEGPAHRNVVTARGAMRDLDPSLHLDRLQRVRAIQYGNNPNGRDLFLIGPKPEPPKPAVTANQGGRSGRGPGGSALAPVMPTPLPPPPPIPLKYIGYATGDDHSQRVVLQMGDDVFLEGEGGLVAQRYLVEKISQKTVTVKDQATGQEQDLPLQQQPGSGGVGN